MGATKKEARKQRPKTCMGKHTCKTVTQGAHASPTRSTPTNLDSSVRPCRAPDDHICLQTTQHTTEPHTSSCTFQMQRRGRNMLLRRALGILSRPSHTHTHSTAVIFVL